MALGLETVAAATKDGEKVHAGNEEAW